MNCYADSYYVHAKISALHSLLLKEKDYYDIIKNRDFRHFLPDMNIDDVKNDYTLIKGNIFDSQIQVVISLADASGSTYAIFSNFLRYFELQNLKLLYSKAFGRNPSPSIWYNLKDTAVLDREMLSSNAGIDAISEYISSTWMKNIIADDFKTTFEEVEFSIDRAALINALEFPYSMSFSDRTDSLKTVSALAAYFRLLWSWRLQYIYSWSQENIKSYIDSNTLPPETGISLQSYVYTWERKLSKEVSAGCVLSTHELVRAGKILERILIRNFSVMFHENFHSVNRIICFLALFYRQIKNLFSIVDGLRFGLAPDMIMQNIICGA